MEAAKSFYKVDERCYNEYYHWNGAYTVARTTHYYLYTHHEVSELR